MKHLKLFFALFAMLALGVGNAWAEESLQVTLDFTTNSWNLPTSKVVEEQSFTSGSYTIKVKGTSGNGYQFNSQKYLIMGKSGATLTLPAFDFNTTKIVVTGRSGASTFVKQNIYVGSNAVSTETTGASGTNTYTINAANQAAGNVYILQVTSAHNTQITKIEVYGESNSTEPPTPTQLTAPANLKEASITEISATLSWDAVANASNYSVTINGNTETVTTNSYSATGLTAGTEYTWSVVAKGDGTNYTDSDAAQHTFTTTATTPDPEPGTGTNVTYDFTKIDGFEDWPTAYASGKGDVVYTEATVKFTGAVKQTQTITDCPVTKGGEVQLVLNSGYSDRDITNVTFVCKQWGSKAQTITLHYSTDGGVNYTNTEITSTNFTISSDNLPEGTNAVKITFSSTGNQVGIASVTFSLSGGETPDPTCTAITPTLSYESTTLLTGNNSSNPSITGNTGNGTVTYASSNTEVATVNESGVITALKAGTATITATIASSGEYCDGMATVDIIVKQLVSCADIYNLADNATFVLNDFVVTYVNGDYTYIKDDAGYGLIFTKDASDYNLKAGDKVASGKFEGKKTTYKTLVEIIPITAYDNLNATSGTAPEPEVMINTPTNADINKYVKFENVSFKYTNLNDTYKTNSGKLEGQTEYNIAFYNKFTSNVTFDTSKKYDVVGVVSIKDDAIEVYFISAEEVAEPTLNVEITNADFGKVAINGTRERTLTLNGSLLTNTVSLAIEGEGAEHFTLASNSVTPVDGKIEEAKIKIYYQPTVEGDHTATLKITSDELAVQTITLTGQAVQQHTVHFFVNSEEQTELAKKVLSGNTLEELPTATSCDLLNYPTFAGWTSAEIDGTTDVKPTMLDQSTPITSECNYYAVFEKGTTSTGTANISYELVLLPSHFTTSYNERPFTATANEVDGEGTLEVSLTSAGVMKSTDASKGNPIQFRKNSSTTSPGTIYNTTDLEQINSISYADGTNNIASTIIGASQQPTEQEDGKGFFMITNGTSVSYIPSITINFTKTSVSEITTYEYITSCAVVVPTCEITYDFDGGEGECTTDIVEKDTEYTLCATAPTKAGHTFLNWKDQHGTEYTAGATITSVTEDLTLTAQWQVNSYSVTWISLGDEVLVNSANYNTQPTKPATALSYTCGIGSKEFVGWTTQEIDGVGVPANLYTDEFPVVTEAITYHAVFASKIEGGGSMSKAVSLTNGETVYLATESGIGVTGANTITNKDATISTTQGDWMPFTVVTNGLQYQFKNGDNYITAAAKSFKITETPSDFAFENGYIVYNVPSGSNAGDYVLLYNSNGGSFYRFYKKSNIDNANYETFYVYKNPTHTDYVTSCPVLELTEGENTLADDVTADVKVNRSFTTGILYTISLPFALNAAQVNEIFGVGTALYQFAQLAKEGEELVLYFSKPSAIAAATPYLIQPTQDVAAGFIVEDAVISTTPNNISFTVGATTITMKPILSAADGAKTNGSTEYWLAADTWLYNKANTLLSLRALFDITTISGMPPRCRVALDENVETGVEDIITTDAPVKVIENEQLIIIRDGVKYNLQGQKL